LARSPARYSCQQCGAGYAKWQGRCNACGGANTISEETAREAAPKGLGRAKGRHLEFASLAAEAAPAPRRQTGIGELDRVLGGVLVEASATLIGGDPGIGKSTLMLQCAARMAAAGADCVYVSGEEAVAQIGLRAGRLGLARAPVRLAAATSLRDIVTTLEAGPAPDLVVVDSIQTLYHDGLDSAPGTVAQVRASAQELVRYAKRAGSALVLVGHVTKDGQIAGPRVVEHMVDAVLYFEGERGHQFRILRAHKNRFGATDEIGVFEMTDAGLAEVANPSALFLGQRDGAISGAAVFAGLEGTRPVLVEIQALVAPTPMATPRRTVVGWDSGRLAMMLAVLEARAGLAVGGNDVYLNVAGGLRVVEPAADLAVAAALVSSIADVAVPEGTVLFGEVGLSGEVRAVAQADQRLKEAAKLGFDRAIVPAGRRPPAAGVDIVQIGHLGDLVAMFPAVEAGRRDRAAQG